MKVLVTGAAGFVGGGLLPRLIDDGHSVCAAVRTACDLPVETVMVGDIGPETDWTAALAGVDIVIHLAARVHVTDERESDALAAFRRVNVEGTRALAEQARRAGVRRFILMSSVKAAAETSRALPLVESSQPFPQTSYGVSKWEGEQALAVAAAGAMETVVLRPPLVYGPGVGANFRSLLRLVNSGLPLPFGAVRNRRSLIARDNLVDAVVTAMDAPGAAGGTFYVSDGPALSTGALAAALGSALNRQVRLLPIPVSLVRLAVRYAAGPDAAESLLGSLEIDDDAFRQKTGWRPPVAQSEAFRAVAAWYRAI